MELVELQSKLFSEIEREMHKFYLLFVDLSFWTNIFII